MKKITFGTPEKFVPTHFCKTLNYTETDISYDVSRINFKETARGCLLELPLQFEEQIYGGGLQLKGFNHKNHKLKLRVNSDPVANTGDSHAPVPFFISTGGYGIFVDSARYIDVFFGISHNCNREPHPDNTVIATAEDLYNKVGLKEETVMTIDIPVAKGVDLYIFEGKNITDIVSQYNMFSGGGCEVPDWGLGVFYRCYAKNTGDDVMKTADYFRENDIPCDVIGLEPGWHTNSYSCSYLWDTERFPNYKEVIAHLKEKDFHINLWEHAFVNAAAPFYREMRKYCGDIEVWKGLIPDFSTEGARKLFAGHHRDYLIDEGIDGFKLDECDNSEYVHDWSFPDCTEFPSGMDGEQYHTMFGVLYMQTILEALGETKTLSEVRSAGALSAPYPFALYSDLYDHKDFIRGVVNSGFSGILWCPEVRHAKSEKDLIRRIQTVVFSAQCLINAWYCVEAPWIKWGCEDKVRELLKVRKTLVPMLKTAFEEYRKTGKAPVRALVSDYTDDPETYGIDNQYIFCDKLIVAPMTEADGDCRKVYLPEGKWVDFWTKKPVNPGWFEVNTENIPVFEKM